MFYSVIKQITAVSSCMRCHANPLSNTPGLIVQCVQRSYIIFKSSMLSWHIKVMVCCWIAVWASGPSSRTQVPISVPQCLMFHHLLPWSPDPGISPRIMPPVLSHIHFTKSSATPPHACRGWHYVSIHHEFVSVRHCKLRTIVLWCVIFGPWAGIGFRSHTEEIADGRSRQNRFRRYDYQSVLCEYQSQFHRRTFHIHRNGAPHSHFNAQDEVYFPGRTVGIHGFHQKEKPAMVMHFQSNTCHCW